MNYEDHSQTAIDELSQVVREQQRQIAALSAGLAAARQVSGQQTGRTGRLGLSGGAALCLALVFGTVALAAIPGNGGVISGCYAARDRRAGRQEVRQGRASADLEPDRAER